MSLSRFVSAPAAALVCMSMAAPGCSGGGGEGDCPGLAELEIGDDGHPDPLAEVAPGQARAGRIRGDELPASTGGLAVWQAGDFVLANDRLALVIEDVGPSDLYDPWGGRPVGLAAVQDGRLVTPANFGEFFILTGRQSVLTRSVSVMSDGTGGQAAVVRAAGFPAPTPFFEPLVGSLFSDEYGDIPTAIDYVLEPDADHVDIYVLYNSARPTNTYVGAVMHGFMYTPRMPLFAPGLGFDTENERVPYLGFVDDQATSYAYSVPGQELGSGIYASGFASNFTDPFDILACAQTRRHYARLTVGGPGVDGLLQAVARAEGSRLRSIAGVVTQADGAPAEGVRVHATDDEGGYITRTLTSDSGAYTLHVPEGQAVELTAWRRGDSVITASVAANQSSADIQLAAAGFIHVVAMDHQLESPLPVRIQVLATDGAVPGVPGYYGEPEITGGRVHVDYAMDGQATLRVPEGDWEVVVSRGYEYEIHREIVSVGAGDTVEVQARVEHVVDTTGYLCADFHIHTHRSADSGDDAREKLRSAVADGLELPVRTEHEYVDTFQPVIDELGLADWAFGVGSIEMTSFQAWGHMGVVPLEPDAGRVNAGAPLWQRYPTAETPDVQVETLLPPEVFAAVRARPEQPIIIINHPRRSTNYFTIADYDPVTGEVGRPEYWDEEFRVVEVFNDSSWLESRDETVADWLSFLDHGRRVFAVGSSDSHRVRTSPIGYPRTCLDLGTDDPREVTAELVRDATGGGHSMISGGIYVYASVNGAGPGDEATVPGSTATLQVRVEAPAWVDVDWIEIVVDGEVVDTIGVLPDDADPDNPAIRFQADVPVQVAPALGSYVIVAAYGDQPLDPVHPGKLPFGVTNPIFLIQ